MLWEKDWLRASLGVTLFIAGIAVGSALATWGVGVTVGIFCVVLLARLAVPDERLEGELIGWTFLAYTVFTFSVLVVILIVLPKWTAVVAIIAAMIANEYLLERPLKRRVKRKGAGSALDDPCESVAVCTDTGRDREGRVQDS